MRLFLHGRSSILNLMQQLRGNQQSEITCLYLSSWTFANCGNYDNEVPQLLTAFAEFLDKNRGISEIVLQNCDSVHLKVLLPDILESSPQTLTIRYDIQQHMPQSIVTGLVQGRQTRIQQLNLQGTTLDSHLLEALQVSILENFLSLQKLSVRGRITLHDVDKGVSIFGEKCDSQSYFAVEDSSNRFSSLLMGIPDLKCLELEYCHLEDEQLATLLNAALTGSALETLKLRGNQCQEVSMRTLSKHLRSTEATLENLDLTWQRLPREAAAAPIPRPTVNQTPRFCAKLPLKGVPLLANALSKNSSLKNLILSENKIREIDFECLVEALEANSTLESLELQDCRLRSLNLRCLAKSLPKLRLKTLQIDGVQKLASKHEEKAVRSLFLLPLAKNECMENLGINCRSKSIDWLLDWNSSGRPAVDQSDIPSSLVPFVSGRQEGLFSQIETLKGSLHESSKFQLIAS